MKKLIYPTLAVLMIWLIASQIDFATARPLPAPNPTPTFIEQEDQEKESLGVTWDIQEFERKRSVYIIRLPQASVATYAGGIPGLEATSAQATGKPRLDINSRASRAYFDYLSAIQARTLTAIERRLGRPIEVLHQYLYVYNGMAVELSSEEAEIIAARPDVAAVIPDVAYEMATDAGPAWIGADSVWQGSVPDDLPGTQGEGVIVGILDSGINMDHPSFAATTADGYTHTNPFGTGVYKGWCDPSHPKYDPAYVCNDKLIGAWDYADESWAGSPDEENDGPEDNDGHGSHTASTVAGNKVNAEYVAPTTTIAAIISGVAPHANIIAYDICAERCFVTDSIAAAQQALEDGVDVINFSIGGGSNPWEDVDRAFLDLVAAGIFVSASAGNSGPTARTVVHLGPWVSTVAASTHNRAFTNSIGDFSGSANAPDPITGRGLTAGYGPAPLVFAGDVPSTLTSRPELCGVGMAGSNTSPWPADTFNGEIVICERGTYGRVEKGENVKTAGAGGYILVDNGTGLVGDAHVLPGLHITQADGQELINWVSAANLKGDTPTGTIQGSQRLLSGDVADFIAGFSSRGPAFEVSVLKPDLTAPGVDIWAADHTPAGGSTTPEYHFLSGTSMASPHNAGSAALLRALYPAWSPSQIASALMMTSVTFDSLVSEHNQSVATPFDGGAGRLSLFAAARAGLVMDETEANFLAANPATGGDARTLNLPSLYNERCSGQCLWQRTLTNPTDTTLSWQASYAGSGVGTITPATFTLDPKASITLSIAIHTQGLSSDTWYFGKVLLAETSDAAPAAHLPVAFQAVVASPDISVDPKSLSSSQTPDSLKTTTLDIANNGSGDVTWEFTSTVTGGTDPFWVQPRQGNSGIVSDFYTEVGGGTYTANDFTIDTSADVGAILVEGFLNGAELAQTATQLTWIIYADEDGQPAGHPEDGLNTALWRFSATPSATGVSTEEDDVLLHLIEAGAPPLSLAPGTYWLTVYPDLNVTAFGRWNWSEGASADSEAMLIDPGNNFDLAGEGWLTLSTDLGVSFTDTAFALYPIITCSLDTDIPWLGLSASSGTTLPGRVTTVDVTFDSTGLAMADYEANLCLSSNDPDTPLIPIPTRLTVMEDQLALVCNEGAVRFESGIPPGWIIDTIAGFGWSDTAGSHCGSGGIDPGNFAGAGVAACADSDATGGLDDTYLCTPPLDFSDVTTVELSFLLNYQVFLQPDDDDIFEVVAITKGAGGGEASLFSTNTDYPSASALMKPNSGGQEFLSLDDYAGLGEVTLCFHYKGDNDWYAHLDDVELACTLSEPKFYQYIPLIRRTP